MTAFLEVAAAPDRFDLVRALRLYECAHPDRPRLGETLRPGEDQLRLGQLPSLRFAPPLALAPAEPPTATGRPRLSLLMLGLLGPSGPLPLHLTEYVLERSRHHGDQTLRAFLDIFHHRLLSLFWRAHRSAEPAIEADRPASDAFAERVLALCGFATTAPPGPPTELRGLRRHWAGHLGRQARNVEGLEALLGEFFRLPVRVEPFLGRWLPLPVTEQCRLGSPNALLGESAFLGEELWDCTQTVRVVLGPVGRERYEQLLPGGRSWQRLRQLVRDYLGDAIAWEARLVLHAAEVPAARLLPAVDQGPDARHRIGWTAWLGDEPATANRQDVVLRPEFRYRHDLASETEHE